MMKYSQMGQADTHTGGLCAEKTPLCSSTSSEGKAAAGKGGDKMVALPSWLPLLAPHRYE